MAHRRLPPIGTWNILSIAIIVCIVGFLSVFSLAGIEQLNEMKAHWLTSFVARIGILMVVSFILTGLLMMLNMVIQYIVDRQVDGKKVFAVMLWSLLSSLITAIIGSCTLLS